MDMTLSDFQDAANKTAVYPNQGSYTGLLYTVLGLASEAGEVASVVKNMMMEGATEESQAKLLEELGDTQWFLAQVCTELGESLAGVAEGNQEKLERRFREGTLRAGDRE